MKPPLGPDTPIEDLDDTVGGCIDLMRWISSTGRRPWDGRPVCEYPLGAESCRPANKI